MDIIVYKKSNFLEAINWIWSFNFTEAEKYFSADGAASPIASYYYAEVRICTFFFLFNFRRLLGSCVACIID